MALLGNGTLQISSDGGKTWQALNCSSFEIIHDEAGDAKEILLPARVMSVPLTKGPGWKEKLARIMAEAARPLSISNTPPKKKKAQWKQSPLSRFSR